MSTQGFFILKSIGSYNFISSSAFYRRCRFEIDGRFDEDLFVRALEFENQSVLIKIDCKKSKRFDGVTVEWYTPGLLGNKSGFRRMLGSMFYLDFDPERFYRLRLDKAMKRLAGAYSGFRPILVPSVFEAAAWSIIGQQVNLNFAYMLKMRLMKLIDRTFMVDGMKYYVFPRPSDIAKLSCTTLRNMQFSERKAEYLIGFARRVDRGSFDVERLKTDGYEAALEKLLAIRGIGPWSANYILLRGSGHRDAFPLGDSGINNAVRRLYKLDRKPGNGFIIELAENWRPYRSLATYYLWKSLQEV